jgi:hypothetical protein
VGLARGAADVVKVRHEGLPEVTVARVLRKLVRSDNAV